MTYASKALAQVSAALKRKDYFGDYTTQLRQLWREREELREAIELVSVYDGVMEPKTAQQKILYQTQGGT